MTTPDPYDNLRRFAYRAGGYLRQGDVAKALIELDRLISEADTLALMHRTEPLPVEVDG
jgi:hypothetical protein